MEVKFTYVFDAYCGWCHGFGRAITEFAAANTGRIALDVVSGGLFTGTRVAPVASMPYVAEANARIAELTGAEFGPGYHALVADGRFRMDSTAAARGFAALRTVSSEALEAATAMQHAFYVDGLSLSEASTYRRLAQQLGLDIEAVSSAFASPRTQTLATEDFTRAAQLGVTSYPTLLLHTATGVVRLGGPAATAAHLTDALDRHLASVSE
jgi:putative protein-disulfide isomerase